MYVCPDCKGPLEDLHCTHCQTEFDRNEGFPVFLSHDPQFREAREIASAYNSIYHDDDGVWERVGRTPQFIDFFSSLLRPLLGDRFLEIGCGEGHLLSRLQTKDKFAVDLSIQALAKSRSRTTAQFSVALAERLPFENGYFDAVATVGVMEHFLDTAAALREIGRVLRPGGHYVNLVHVRSTFLERLSSSFFEYAFPRPRPLALARRFRPAEKPGNSDGKAPAKQPIQNRYTTQGVKRLLHDCGFQVVDVLHRRKTPSLPLRHRFVVIYVARNTPR